MIRLDLLNRLSVTKVINPAANSNIGTTAQVGATIDHANTMGTLYVIQTGTLSDADAVYSVLLEESDNSDMSSSNAVDDVDMITMTSGTAPEAAAAFNYADDNSVRRLGYIGSKRYTRLTITPTTTADSGDTPLSAVAIQVMRARGNVTGS